MRGKPWIRISFQTRQQKAAITGQKRIHGALARQFQATILRGLYFIQEHMLSKSDENHKGELDEIAVEFECQDMKLNVDLLALFHAVRTINSTCAAAAAQIPFYNARADDIIPSRSAATQCIYRSRRRTYYIRMCMWRLDAIRKIKRKKRKQQQKNQARVRVNDFLE
uniref:Uncharacterized protein n=1 Tax=Trichogramma kaykai TaxID=54128 RepID=A0ABD2W7J5_9HYME